MSSIAFRRKPWHNDQEPPVTLVICSYNERENLAKHLPLWLKQSYKNLRILIVDHGSTDGTRAFLEGQAKAHQKLEVLHVERNQQERWPGKREALYNALQYAGTDKVLLTDADCFPATSDWVRIMLAASDGHMVLGFSPYTADGAGLMASFLTRLETSFTARLYGAAARFGRPYMGVGRNMLIERKVYLDWLIENKHTTLSGDDDLFVQYAARMGYPFSICTNPDGFTLTYPPQNVGFWRRQKKRHVSAATHYDTWSYLFAGLWPVVNASWFLFSAVLLCFLPMLVVAAYLFRLLWLILLLPKSLARENKHTFIVKMICLEPYLWGNYIILALLGKNDHSKEW